MDVHIRLYDPAIDWTPEKGTPLDTWPHTRDASKLVLRPGMTPMRFHCVRLKRSVYSWVMEGTSEEERTYRAFRAGVRRVERPSEGSWTPANVDSRTYTAMTEDEADTFGIADHQEIGGLIIERSVLPTDCGGGFSVRPSSRLVLVAVQRTLHSAEQSLESRTPTSKQPAAPSVEPARKRARRAAS